MINVGAKILIISLQLISVELLTSSANAQSNAGRRKIFTEAESYNLFNESELANPLYLLLEKPDNYNILYKIGTSYLNIPGEKVKAIPYLEKAVKHSSYEAKIASLREKRAPLDSYFFLGKAYMINNELDKALTTFELFKKLALETEEKGGMKNFPFIDRQIEACKVATTFEEAPSRISRNLLSSNFSQGSFNENPAVSFDGNTIVYTERRGIVNAIMYSRKIRGKWQPPVEINSQLKSGEDCSSCSLNKDGTLLLLYKSDNFDGNIYSAENVNGTWKPVKKLNRNINTRFYESHAAISADGRKLYFTSNREGGIGGLDIYVSEKDSSGDWGPAKNLGNKINTVFNEDTPFITLNDSLLYFSSEGFSGMGGYDIYRSRGNGSAWEDPENLGFPVNSTDDDSFFQPFNNDENGFYSFTTAYKKKEIFYITLSKPSLNKVFEITGNYSLKDTVVIYDEKSLLFLIDKNSGDTLDTGYPDSRTGKYSFIVAPGNFRIVYTFPGYYEQIIDTAVVLSNPSKLITLRDVILDKTKPVVYEKLNLSNIPVVNKIDSGILIKDLRVQDVTENDLLDTTILYYTVQVMALYNPVDISYFKYVSDIKVLYNDADMFYRYTTGRFDNKPDAYAHLKELIEKGYPDDLFVKKVSRLSNEKQIPEKRYYTIQLKATQARLDIKTVFEGLIGIREVEEIDGYHYLYGQYTSMEEARSVLQRTLLAKFKDAFVREIKLIVKD